jgi:hypothetical protein
MTDSYIQTPEERIDDLARDVLVAGYLARTASSPRTTPPPRRTRSNRGGGHDRVRRRRAPANHGDHAGASLTPDQVGRGPTAAGQGGDRTSPRMAPRSAVSWAHPGPVAVRSCSAPKSGVRQRAPRPQAATSVRRSGVHHAVKVADADGARAPGRLGLSDSRGAAVDDPSDGPRLILAA